MRGDGDRDLTRVVLDHLPVLAAYLDRDQRYLLANEAYGAFFGRTADEIVSMHIAELLGPELYPSVVPEIEGALSGVAQEFERPVKSAHGVRHVRVHYQPDLRDGVVRGVVIQVHDITDQRHAAMALSLAEERFRTLFEAAPTATLLTDEAGLIVTANAAAGELLGYARSDLAGRHASELIHPDERASAVVIRQMLYDEGVQTYSGERRYVRSDGTVVWAQADITAIGGTVDSEDRFLLAQLQDIGARKRYQEQLEFLAHHDSLTGLLNRRGFHSALEAQTEQNRSDDGEAVVLVLDLDGFKTVNDLGGHAAGDRLLIDVADALRETLGPDGVIARLGGDEFAMLIPGSLSTVMATAGAAVVSAVNLTAAPRHDQPVHGITASAGIAAFGGAMTGDRALIAADQAMYRAKNSGRNRLSL